MAETELQYQARMLDELIVDLRAAQEENRRLREEAENDRKIIAALHHGNQSVLNRLESERDALRAALAKAHEALRALLDGPWAFCNARNPGTYSEAAQLGFASLEDSTGTAARAEWLKSYILGPPTSPSPSATHRLVPTSPTADRAPWVLPLRVEAMPSGYYCVCDKLNDVVVTSISRVRADAIVAAINAADTIRRERDAVVGALAALINKLDEIEANPSYQGLNTIAYVHGYRYSGPNYAEEKEAARALIADRMEKSDG